MNNHQNFSTIGEEGYLHLLEHILLNGYVSGKERTGTGTLVSSTPHQLHFPNVEEQFPLFTTKYVSFNMLACEMLWFISGYTNVRAIEQIGSPRMADVWKKWADDHGELGPVYPKQWREWEDWKPGHTKTTVDIGRGHVKIDQLQNVIDGIKENPEGRRHIVSAWNPADLDDMALPPCHLMYQFTCEPISEKERWDRVTTGMAAQSTDLDFLGVPKYKLHLHLTQRSCDMFLGVPFNVAQYALLLQLVAQITNTITGDFTWTGVNCHIYRDHIEAVEEQLSRERYNPPKLKVSNLNSIDDYIIDDFLLLDYNHHPKIKAKVSI